MNIMSEKEFLEELKIKAERLKLNKELSKEMGYSDFLYYAYLFIKKLEERNINYSLHHIHGGSGVLSVLLAFESIERIYGGCIFINHFVDELDDEQVPSFTVCVSSIRKEEAVTVLDKIVDIDFEHSSYNAYYFGKNHRYHINVLSSPYIDRLDKLEELIGLDNDEIIEGDIDTIKYMLEIDDKGYYLPHLNGCYFGSVKHLYQMIEIIKPDNLFDLIKLGCLDRAEYKDFSLVLESLKTNGLEFTLYSKEQLKHLLVDIYDIPFKEASFIIKDVSKGKILLDSQKDILISHEVPEYIIKQFDNIQYLPYLIFDYFKMRLVYMLAYYKKNYLEEFLKVLEVPYQDSYVGPFFYINGELYGHTEKMINFNPNIRFFDSGTSHFDYFNSLHIDIDYGHYPRGRVIFDNLDKKFIVYIDITLNKKKIKESINHKYNLPNERTICKYDGHYKHDSL